MGLALCIHTKFITWHDNNVFIILWSFFLDAIESLEIPYIQVTPEQSADNLLGQGSRPFRQSKDVKKGNIAILAITDSMVILAITAIRAIIASTGIRDTCSQYNCYCQ